MSYQQVQHEGISERRGNRENNEGYASTVYEEIQLSNDDHYVMYNNV